MTLKDAVASGRRWWKHGTRPALEKKVIFLYEKIHRFSCAPDGGGHSELCEYTGAAQYQRDVARAAAARIEKDTK
jgi:hypothetical protein